MRVVSLLVRARGLAEAFTGTSQLQRRHLLQVTASCCSFLLPHHAFGVTHTKKSLVNNFRRKDDKDRGMKEGAKEGGRRQSSPASVEMFLVSLSAFSPKMYSLADDKRPPSNRSSETNEERRGWGTKCSTPFAFFQKEKIAKQNCKKN